MTFLLIRRIGILALLGLAGIAVLISALSAFSRGLEARELASQTRQTVEPLQDRLEAMISSRQAGLAVLRARAWTASDEASARAALRREIEAAFQDGVMLNLASSEASGAQIDFQLHWRGEEDALQQALLYLQVPVPNLGLDSISMRIVEFNGQNLIELEARASHVWMAP